MDETERKSSVSINDNDETGHFNKLSSSSLESSDEVGSTNHDDSLNNLYHGSTNDSASHTDSTDRSSTSPWFKLITIEPLILLYSYAFTLTSPVTTTMFLTHTCRSMGFNQSYCSQLEGTGSKELEGLVQPETNILKLYEMLAETGLPAVLTLFIGPWSDLHGRKTFMLCPIVGVGFKYLICLCMSFYPALPAQYLLLASVPVAMSGGMISVISMCYCYITDISERDRRGFRMGIVEASFYSGLLLGTTTSTFIFASGKYLAVFAIAAALCLLAVVHGLCFVQESIQNIQGGSFYRSFFQPHLVKEMITVCCGQKHRRIILLIVTALAAAVVTMEGEGSVQFLFTRYKFSWDIKHYMMYSSVNLVLQIIGTITAVSVLSAWLGMSDGVISAASFVLKATGSVLLAISPSDWWMYLAAAVGMFGSVAGPLSRAIISKSVDPRDVGKVFSLVASVEAITPLAAGPLYALVYNSTLLRFPGAFYLMSAAIFVMNFILLSVVVCIQRRTSTDYNALTS